MGAPNGNDLGLFILLGSVLTLVLLFLILAIVGLVRIRKPGSQWFVLTGFVGLALSLEILSFLGYEVLYTFDISGIFNFEQRQSLMAHLARLWLILPVLAFLGFFLSGKLNRAAPGSASFMRIGCIGTIAILLFTLYVSIFSRYFTGHGVVEAVIKGESHAIQIALERYAVDHNGHYPKHIGDLLGTYLGTFPLNQFTATTIKNVDYGAPDVAGNLTYLPISINDEVVGYYLLVYGSPENPGLMLMGDDQPDHVILVLQNREDNPAWPPDTPFPSVKDVILSSQQ